MYNTQIRVIVPAFNAENTIVACIEAILESVKLFPNTEIFIVDNGRNPNLVGLTSVFPITLLKRYQTASAAYARNEGAKDFLTGCIIFIDSDVVCERHCIQELIAPIHNGDAIASIGNYSTNIKGLTFTQKYKQLYINFIYNRNSSKFINDFWTAIGCIKAETFHKLNGFKLNFKGAQGEDQELGMRLSKQGYKVAFVKNANGQHFHKYGIYKLLRNDFKKGINTIKNSVENNVSISDNRHSKKNDILSVLFSILTVITIPLYFTNSIFIILSIIFFILWVYNRINLINAFFHNGGALFLIRAIILMYVLDLVRFSCVIIGFIQYKFLGIEIIK
jgi:GT2 family glycosyltransferase